MASFHIHQDAEKENPHNKQATVKEKFLLAPVVNKVHNVLQPSALGSSVSSAAAGVKQQQQQHQTQRSNFVLLNNGNNTNVTNNKQVITHRDAANIKENDENAGYQKKKSTSTAGVPFTVYEDCVDEDVEKQPIAQQKNNIKKASQFDTNKAVLHERQSAQVKQKSFLEVSHENYALDTTPMSVTDVLSPMSVDRSTSTIDLVDEEDDDDDEEDGVVVGSNSTTADIKKLLNEQKTTNKKLNIKEAIPPARRDRDRFFDVVEYQADILEYFRESEQKHRPKPHYMRRQSDINQSMRTIMVDWLVEVSEEYNLDTETLYLSVSYIDRFLSQMSVMRNKLQLVGTSAMYIASKYEEIYPPEVNDFVFITDDTFNKSQILRMEQIILKILSFDLCTPTPYVYINMYAAIMNMDAKYKALVLYISELSLLDADPYLKFLPSAISAAACALASYTLFDTIWTKQLEEVTAYKLEDLKEVFICLSKTHNVAVNFKLQAIQDKYKADKYYNVSTIEPMAELSSDGFDFLVYEYNELNNKSKELENQWSELEQSPTSAKVNDNVRRMISLMFKDKPNSNNKIENVTVAKD